MTLRSAAIALPRLALALALATAFALTGCGGRPGPAAAQPEHDAPAGPAFERGPHRGRLLRDGAFALELQILEEGVPPEFHVYLFRDGKPVAPAGAAVSVELTRLDGEVNRIGFAVQDDFLRGDSVVHEPHSFSVVVEAAVDGASHRWTFDSFEGRTTIAAATAEAAGVKTAVAGPATLAEVVSLRGRLVPNAERVRSVSPRFPGPVRQVLHSVGDSVRAGEPLAVVESNESLTNYTVTAPIAGTVIERRTNPGETATGEPMFVIADYRSLWAELTLFPRDLARVKAGQRVALHAAEGDLAAEGRIQRVTPALDGASQLKGLHVARVELPDPDRRWAPGLFVRGDVEVASVPVPLAVRRSALQDFRDFRVVFAQVGETYEVRMLELGREDATWVEVLGGLKPGTPYVAENSYLIKADIEKPGASHDH